MPAFRYIAAPSDQSLQFFPWPVPPLGDLPTGPGTNRPFPMTLEQAVELWWRVAAFTADVSLNQRVFFQAPSESCPNGDRVDFVFPNQSMVADQLAEHVDLDPRNFVLLDEWESATMHWGSNPMVGTRAGFDCSGVGSGAVATQGSSLSIRLGGDVIHPYTWAPPFARDLSGNLWPNLDIQIGPFIGPNAPAGDYISHTLALVIPSGAFPVTLYANISSPDSATLTVTEIRASAFRTYDPGDGGGPIWHPTTGEQLRDPFSVQ